MSLVTAPRRTGVRTNRPGLGDGAWARSAPLPLARTRTPTSSSVPLTVIMAMGPVGANNVWASDQSLPLEQCLRRRASGARVGESTLPDTVSDDGS